MLQLEHHIAVVDAARVAPISLKLPYGSCAVNAVAHVVAAESELS